MKRRIAAGIAATAMILASWTYSSQSDKAPIHLEEDEPGWDCQTMGNRTCGEVQYICADSTMTADCRPMRPNPDFDSKPG